MEDKPINKLFSYECPSCGGYLETDDNRKLMVCRSCGRTYDYDYFSEEHLLEAADKALNNSNFSSAADMYSFMLDKEPSNLKALRGLILASNKVNRLYGITTKIKNGSFVTGTFNLRKYRDTGDPEALLFFEKTDRILSLHKEYVELKKTMKGLDTEENSVKQKLREGNDDSYESDDSLKTKLIVAAVVFVLLVITAFAFGMDFVTPRWLIAILVIAMGGAFFTVLTLLVRMIINKNSHRKNAQKNPLLTELDGIDEKIDKNNAEMSRIIRDINAVFKDMNDLADGK